MFNSWRRDRELDLLEETLMEARSSIKNVLSTLDDLEARAPGVRSLVAHAAAALDLIELTANEARNIELRQPVEQ